MERPDHRTRGVMNQDVQWDRRPAEELLGLPEGPEMKLLARDPVMKRVDFKLKYPKGYVLPRHTHRSWHVSLVTGGRVRPPAGGRDLRPRDVVFGWDRPHGPFEFLEESEVFVVMIGDGTDHVWDRSGKTEPAGAGNDPGRCRIFYDEDLYWDEDAPVRLLGQPEGGGVKVYFRDPAMNLIVFRRQFPPGYVEPEHVHKSWHSSLVLGGRACVSGMERHAGDYGFGWDEPHGPFEYPDGCEVFALMIGESTEHLWDEDRYLRYRTKFKAETQEGKEAVARGDADRKRRLEEKEAKRR